MNAVVVGSEWQRKDPRRDQRPVRVERIEGGVVVYQGGNGVTCRAYLDSWHQRFRAVVTEHA